MSTVNIPESERGSRPDDDAGTVPFADHPQTHRKKVLTNWQRMELSNGAVVKVGHQPDRPDGPAFVHVCYLTQESGKRTRLEFALTPEACIAIASMYARFGLFDSLMRDAAAMQERLDEFEDIEDERRDAEDAHRNAMEMWEGRD